MRRTHAILAALAGFAFVVTAQAAPPSRLPDADPDDFTPLSRMLTRDVDEKLKNHPTKECRDKATGNARPKGPRDFKTLDCSVPAVDVKNRKKAKPEDTCTDCCADCGGEPKVNPATGKVVGRTTKNEMTIYYGKPSHRLGEDGKPMAKWPEQRFNNARSPNEVELPATDSVNPGGNVVVGAQTGKNDLTHRTDSAGKPVEVPPFDCKTFKGGGGVEAGDGTCDLSAVMIKEINAKAKASTDSRKQKEIAIAADENGVCSDKEEIVKKAAVKCGDENQRRAHRVKETYTVECNEGEELVDGACRKEVDLATAPVATLAKAVVIQPGTDKQVTGGLMGFTFAPPRIRWGWDYSEDVCIDLLFDDFCFTIFSAFVGYDIDVAAGLRLPVEVSLDGIPKPALAQTTTTLKPTLMPADFSQADYRDFCRMHGMNASWAIADCERFSFPEYFSSQFAQDYPATYGANGLLTGGVEVDGKEFVAQAVIKAGVFVELFGIPIVSAGVNAGNDYATLCTMMKLARSPSSLLAGFNSAFGDTAASANAFLDALKDAEANCASFKTPFGDRYIDGKWVTPTLPFLPDSVHIPAECKGAPSASFTIKGKPVKIPFCTGLVLRYGPVGMGLGMKLRFRTGSGRMEANWSTAADATGSGTLAWIAPVGTEEFAKADLGPVTFDNYASGTRDASLKVNGLKYCINQLAIGLDATLDFGGLLSFLPSLITLPVYDHSFASSDCTIPIPQHHDTGPMAFSTPVTNYALRLTSRPVATDGTVVTGERVAIKPAKPESPGGWGTFKLSVQNLGTDTEDVDNFALPTLENWTSGAKVEGLFSGSNWQGTFSGTIVADVASGNTATDSQEVRIKPWRNYTTKPGNYTVVVNADSKQARELNLNSRDPLFQERRNARADLLVEVLPFFEPKIFLAPETAGAKPGAPASTYAMDIQNNGNAQDAAAMSVVLVNSNSGGCNFTNLGGTGCPDRAWPTALKAEWTSADEMPARLPVTPAGSATALFLQPGERKAVSSFSVQVPADWAGMTDTEYAIRITATSERDPDTPKASFEKTATYKVFATKESMVRFIGLALDDLATQIAAADAAGVKTGGALPIITKDVLGAHGRAMDAILVKDFGKANTALAVMSRGLAAFTKAIGNLADPHRTHWTARANAVIADLAEAQKSAIQSN